MSVFSIVLLVIGVLVVLGLVGLAGLVIAHRLAARPDRAPVRRTSAAELESYFRRRAAFAVTVSARTSLSGEEVFGRLAERPYLATLPFLSGPHWRDESRGPGAARSMSGTVFSVAEEVLVADPGRELALTGTAVCLPLVIKDFAERFVIDGERVEWTVAGSPRWVGWLPWRLLVPVVRPVLAFVLRHVLRPRTFRAVRGG